MVKAYKGFNLDMTCCRGFQFREDETIKADTWYRLENGEFVECGDDEEE
jgi:hypothetical protein